ncbi:MAG: dTMP kinase [Kordiimonas sp.]|nr:dTMP kinase [Kordiimonas sp.]
MSNKNIAGNFITLEGGEGVGKSTQAKQLQQRLAKEGIHAILTREPGGCDSAEIIRQLLVTGATDKWLPLSEALLHFAARHEHTERFIKPALHKGSWVICDRYTDSTMAYQGYGQHLDLGQIETLQKLVLGDFQPDLTFILDGPATIGLERAKARNDEHSRAEAGLREDRYERMGKDFHETLRSSFQKIAMSCPKRCKIIDATGSIKDVHQRIWQHIKLARAGFSEGADGNRT